MSDERPTAVPDDGGPPKRRRIIAWIIGAVIAALVVGAVIALTLPRDVSAQPDPTASTSARPSSSASPSAEPGAPAESASPDATEAADTPDAEASAPAESNPFPELAPVAPQEPGNADGIEAALTKFEGVTGEVVGPGDVAAPAVRMTVDIKNTGSAPLDLNLVVVNAYMGPERDPAEMYEQPGGKPVSGSLAPGETATGVYIFRIPEDRRDDVTVVVDYQAGLPAITFRGPVG
jgi:hypothetical protein